MSTESKLIPLSSFKDFLCKYSTNRYTTGRKTYVTFENKRTDYIPLFMYKSLCRPYPNVNNPAFSNFVNEAAFVTESLTNDEIWNTIGDDWVKVILKEKPYMVQELTIQFTRRAFTSAKIVKDNFLSGQIKYRYESSHVRAYPINMNSFGTAVISANGILIGMRMENMSAYTVTLADFMQSIPQILMMVVINSSKLELLLRQDLNTLTTEELNQLFILLIDDSFLSYLSNATRRDFSTYIYDIIRSFLIQGYDIIPVSNIFGTFFKPERTFVEGTSPLKIKSVLSTEIVKRLRVELNIQPL